MATSTTNPQQDLLVDPVDWLAVNDNQLVFGATKTDSTATSAAEIAQRPGRKWGDGMDDNTLAAVSVLDTRKTTTTSDATVTTIATVKEFDGTERVVAAGEVWRVSATFHGILEAAGEQPDETIWHNRTWMVFGRSASTTAAVVENDGPNIDGTALASVPGASLDLTGDKMILKVTGKAATVINWEVTFVVRSYNEQ